MSLVAGTVFWFLRWCWRCFRPSRCAFPSRTIAGGAGLICVTIYLALSGAAIAAVRSYIMIAVVFLAILLNRPALSLRNVALAGLLDPDRAAGQPDRHQLPDVVRRHRRADRGLRALRPLSAFRGAKRARAADLAAGLYRWRRAGDDGSRRASRSSRSPPTISTISPATPRSAISWAARPSTCSPCPR